MSRAMNLSMTSDEVMAHCSASNVNVSAMEVLPGGGVRLVCCSTAGAGLIRGKLKHKLLPDGVGRTAQRLRTHLW